MSFEKIQNEICKLLQTIAMVYSCVTIYRNDLIETICTYLFILVIEFTLKDRNLKK
jgi:hypothetical protein